jgi:uncharacterized protein YcbK (DUF882 family)
MFRGTRLVATLAILGGLGGSFSPMVNANVESSRLRLFHTHTGERIDVVFKRGGEYVPEAIAELETFLADFRNGERRPFDPALFDLLAELNASVGRRDAEFHVISAYRSPETNDFLRRTRKGVAEKSLHLEAQAIDIRLPGTSTQRLRDAALALGKGGVGYYRRSNFIHVDTGRVRRW